MPGNAEGGPCYKGQHPLDWAKHVQALNHLHSSVYPCVLEKGITGAWKGVHPSYPEIENFNPEELKPGYQAMDFLLIELVNVDVSKANKEEKSALDVFHSTRKYMESMRSREKVRDVYNKVTPACAEMQTMEFNNSVMVMKVKYQRAKGDRKVELEDRILDRFQAFEDLKRKFEKTLEEFKQASKDLAQREGVPFNQKFNKFQHINYWQMVKCFTINNKSIRDYWDEQETCWADCLTCLDNDYLNKTQVEKHPHSPMDQTMSRESFEESKKMEKQSTFKHKLHLFKDAHEEAQNGLSKATLEELQASLKEITDVQRELNEMIYDPDIQVSDDWKKFIRDSKELPRDITKRITEIQTQKANESERRRQEINSNIKSLEAVKLLPLTGYEDFIAWKKNQKFINTHTDPYKKAAALLGTLKNAQDKKMCETIYDFDKLIKILNDKYNHCEKLVPALKGRLAKLPTAQSDELMLDNIRTILNVYEQLKEIGARESFDGGVVASMIKKLPHAKKDFQRYKTRMRELDNIQTDSSLLYDEDGYNLTMQTKSKDNMDLNIVDSSPEERKLFLQFIREEAKLLDLIVGE